MTMGLSVVAVPSGECSRVGREESLSERRYVPVADMFQPLANHYVVMN